MATQATVVIGFKDSYGKKTFRRFTPRDPLVDDATIQDLAQVMQDYAALSVISASVTRKVDVSAITDPAEAKASRQKDASITFLRSALRNSHGGEYTFHLVEPKATLVLPNNTIDLTAAVWESLRELFDDGAGIEGLVGDWYISDQEELIEEEAPLDGFLNKD